MYTRASSGVSPSCRSTKAIAWPHACPEIRRSPSRGVLPGTGGISGAQIPPRAVWLRALCLELERIANHLGDLGALGNDAGFAFGLAQFSRLKEHLLRATQEALGARYLMSAIVPGGTRLDLTANGADGLATSVRKLRPRR